MAHSGTIIHMRNVPNDDKLRALDQPLACEMPDGTTDDIPVDFEWDGSSSELIYESDSKVKKFFVRLILSPVNAVLRSVFPRHKHPVSSCKHDYRCGKAKNKEERLWADRKFKEGVGTTSGSVDQNVGYVGVRVGAFFGIGNNF